MVELTRGLAGGRACGDLLGRHVLKLIGVGKELGGLLFGGMRGAVGVAALAAGLLLALSLGSGCSLGCPTPEERTYLNEAEKWSARSEAASRELRAILEEVGGRSEVFLDEGWRRRLKRALDELTSAQEAIVNIEAPPLRAEEMHRALVEGAEAYIEGSELLWRGVVEVDAETISRGYDKYREGNRMFEETIAVIERFCE